MIRFYLFKGPYVDWITSILHKERWLINNEFKEDMEGRRITSQLGYPIEVAYRNLSERTDEYYEHVSGLLISDLRFEHITSKV